MPGLWCRVTTHTSATCHFPGVGHVASNLPEPSLQASRATWFFETSLNDAASIIPQPPCANHKPGRPQLSQSRVQASTSPATSTGRPGVTHPTSLGSAAWATRRGVRQAHAALQMFAVTVWPCETADMPLPLEFVLHKENEAASCWACFFKAGKPTESAAGTRFLGCQNLQTTQNRFHWTLFNALLHTRGVPAKTAGGLELQKDTRKIK